MKRRVEDVGSRPEAASAGIGGHLGGSGGYVRAPPSAPSIPGTLPAAGISHEHPPHIGSGYAGAKVEMHAGVNHSINNYGGAITASSHQGSHGNVDTSRSVVSGSVPSGMASQVSGPGSHLSQTQHVLQHGNPPTAIVRPRVSAGGVSHPPSSMSTVLGSGISTMASVAGNNQVAGQFQRLKVEDALSYLDQVKLRFGRQPQVYNDFLDIMKEFKSQSIDTPGVIARVSQLFRGHPELIVGFNTFLPPGYKIEVQVSVTEPGKQTTVVHTPNGIQHHVTPANIITNQPQTVTVKAAPPTLHTPSPRSVSLVMNPQHSPVSSPASMTSLASSVTTTVATNDNFKVSSPLVSIALNSNNLCNVSKAAALIKATEAPMGKCLAGETLIDDEKHSPINDDNSTQPDSPLSSLHQSVLETPAQPVEFNHAINYVNKIKHRFQGQPDIYKQFLEILHTYQKEQKYIKDGGSVPVRTLTEAEVYEKVARLFINQEDLLQEFGQFLPDATNAQAAVQNFMDQYCSNHLNAQTVKNSSDLSDLKSPPTNSPSCTVSNSILGGSTIGPNKSSSSGVETTPPPNNVIYTNQQLKRPLPTNSGQSLSNSPPPAKKPKLSYLKDMSAAEAGKYATLSEYAFFDSVRKAMRHEETYHNFLRCLTLFNEEIVSRSELTQMVHPFLAKFPELLKWFKEFIGYPDGAAPPPELIPAGVAKQERIGGDLAMEVDYTTCKRLGASYCAQPNASSGPSCSGRTALCREVLNDTWVSFPSWSEDSTFVTSRKTQYEEYIYRCEDERFELDVVLETNLATIRILEGVQKKLSKMTSDELKDFKLDDNLGGCSATISQQAIKKIYGDKAIDIIDGLKKNPVVAVPLVLRRLKAKDEEWRDAQKGFNKIWRELNERYYLKSLDHQGLTYKQNDIKTLRSKSLLNDIETLYDERHEQAEEGGCEATTGPHMVFAYKDKSLLDDAANLIIHHVKRQTTIHKEDKAKIKQLIRHFLPDLFYHPRLDLSDDEKDLEEDSDDDIDDDDNDLDDDNSETKSEPINGKKSSFESKESKEFSSNSSSNSNKRKTRSAKITTTMAASSDSEESSTTTTTTKVISSNKEDGDESNVDNIKEEKVTVNGEATEAEKKSVSDAAVKTEIKSELCDDFKPQPFSTAYSSLADDEYRLFIGNNNWYLFMRLHQILCARLATMYEHSVQIATDEAKQRKDQKESVAVALRLKPNNEIPLEDYYPALLDMVQNMLDGNLESTTYEDTLREMFGIHAYNAFTLDKVVSGTVRQLQHIVCDEVPSQCMSMYILEARKGGAGGPIISSHRRLHHEQAYQRKGEKLLTDENCFKIFTYKKDNRVTVELLDTESEGSDENGTTPQNWSDKESNVCASPMSMMHPVMPNSVTQVEGWSEYLQNYANSVSPQFTPAVQSQLARKPVFLPRNLRSYNKKASKKSKTISPTEGPPKTNVRDPGGSMGGHQLMELSDNTHCKFNLNNYKMVYVVNSDSFMYKELSLKRAKDSHAAVTRRKRLGMDKWSKKWSDVHVTEDASKGTNKWFMGESENLLPNRTKVCRIDRTYKPPYFPFNKYKCELLIKQEASS